MINFDISDNRMKEFEGSVGTDKFNEIKDRFGGEVAAIAVMLHTSKAIDLMNLKEALFLIGWESMPTAVVGGSAGPVEAEEPTEFMIVIKSIKADKKIAAIKALRATKSERENQDLSLAEAKGIVEAVADKNISFSGYKSKEEASKDMERFSDLGVVEIINS
ncbi:MAG: hypothetical protein KAH32_02160 [Chlamydiia bacterium]|nr:hypothetical protein [Chlamydiia bacterium]